MRPSPEIRTKPRRNTAAPVEKAGGGDHAESALAAVLDNDAFGDERTRACFAA